MTKTITSPVEEWPGTVDIADPMNWPQIMVMERALNKRQEFFEDMDGKRILKPDAAMCDPDDIDIGVILACVEKWSLEGFPEKVTIDNLPSSPRLEGKKLIAWLFGEIFAIYRGETEIPNE